MSIATLSAPLVKDSFAQLIVPVTCRRTTGRASAAFATPDNSPLQPRETKCAPHSCALLTRQPDRADVVAHRPKGLRGNGCAGTEQTVPASRMPRDVQLLLRGSSAGL